MTTPLDNALKRLAELKAEIARIERFVEDYRAFSDPASPDAELTPGQTIGGNISRPGVTECPVDNSWRARRLGRKTPSELAELMARLLAEAGHPMTRGDLVEAIEHRDVEIPAKDKSRYIGTLAWRHKGTFINIEGRGYWLRGRLTDVSTVEPNTPYSDPAEEHSPELPDLLGDPDPKTNRRF